MALTWSPKQARRDPCVNRRTDGQPGVAATHGCVRVTYAAVDFLWSSASMPLGRRVWVY